MGVERDQDPSCPHYIRAEAPFAGADVLEHHAIPFVKRQGVVVPPQVVLPGEIRSG